MRGRANDPFFAQYRVEQIEGLLLAVETDEDNRPTPSDQANGVRGQSRDPRALEDDVGTDSSGSLGEKLLELVRCGCEVGAHRERQLPTFRARVDDHDRSRTRGSGDLDQEEANGPDPNDEHVTPDGVRHLPQGPHRNRGRLRQGGDVGAEAGRYGYAGGGPRGDVFGEPAVGVQADDGVAGAQPLLVAFAPPALAAA